MAASLDDLKSEIEAAERAVHAADARAAETSRALKAHWRARAPSILIGSAGALLAWQLLGARRKSRRAAAYHPPPSSAWMRTLDPLLRYGGPKLVTVISALVAGLVAKKTHKPLATAPAVDLQRYAGTWYEIARMPDKHEKDCASDVTSTFEPTIDGGLRIVHRCRLRDGSIRRMVGRVEAVDADTNAKLRVSYAPQILDAVPFVWSDYCIIDVAADYSTAVVGSQDRSHLWLLSREPTVSEEVRSAFIAKALGQGFDTSELIYCTHLGEDPREGADDAPPARMQTADAGDRSQRADAAAAAPASEGASAAAATHATDYDRVATTDAQRR